jgi:hypothetical protein
MCTRLEHYWSISAVLLTYIFLKTLLKPLRFVIGNRITWKRKREKKERKKERQEDRKKRE